LFSAPDGVQAADSVCAQVKIEIKQELTLERQAFDAHMRIKNGLSHITLDDIDVDVIFTDEDGSPVLASSDPDNTEALFFIRLDSMENVDDVSGSGTIAPSTTADIHWLIIPAPGASNGRQSGKLYYVGATLTYTIGGDENITEVTPDYIFVKPLPELTLDYFLPEEVYGDDAFTAEIEPPVPFSLGVRVKNAGSGTARDLKIDSAQPKIVDNEQGLLIGFAIESTEVNGKIVADSLLADFGDIAPATSKAARWRMTCTLSGDFVEFTARFSHSDELGGELTSLIDAVNTHLLVRDVLVDFPGRDAVRDFLARDGDLLRVYETDSADTVVSDVSADADLQVDGLQGSLSISSLPAGFIFMRIPDPFGGQKVITEALRSDGKHIKPANVWLSKSRNGQSWDYFINLFDVESTGTYTIRFDDASALPQPPVIQFISDRTAIENQQISFIVEASDPNGTVPSLTSEPLPAGAVFEDQGDGTAVFDWTPFVGQAGSYEISFIASDGALTASRRAVLTIYSVDDTDGDGMPDSWETGQFGSLDRDGSGDFDGDGISDLEEYLTGSNPLAEDHVPSVPVIQTPQEDSEVSALQPELVIVNSTDEDGDAIRYEFEVYSDPGFVNFVASEYGLDQGIDTTAWIVPQPLADNNRYFWRVRATDGYSFSQWAHGSFFVNTVNDPPGAFFISAPADGMEVDSTRPLLEATNSVDIDDDVITYTFEVYADSALTDLVTSAADIPAGPDGTTAWSVDTDLTGIAPFYWRVVATDAHGDQAATPASSFYVHTGITAPGLPVVSTPAAGSEIDALEVDLVIANAANGGFHEYYFEVDTIETFDSPNLLISDPVTEGLDSTVWHIADLADNTRYFWRVKTGDGAAESGWVVSDFFVDTANEAPAMPVMRNPGSGAWVLSLTPQLSVHQVSDPDADPMSFQFEIYADEQLTDLALQHESTSSHWTPPTTLMDRTRYYWRARAVDEHGLAGDWTPAAAFFVQDSGINQPPTISLVLPAEGIFTNADSLAIQWEDSDPDSNASIALYYDTDNTGEDGLLIADNLLEDPDADGDGYTWDISALEGTYFLYAVIADEKSTDAVYGSSAVTIDRTPPSVQATPAGGSYPEAQSVALSSNEIANIYYTLDGSEPTTGSTLYSAPLEITQETTLKCLAVDPSGNAGAVITESYIVGAYDMAVQLRTSKGRLLSGIKVYAFTESGSYTGINRTTDSAGNTSFNPADFSGGSHKFRADYLGSQFWSAVVPVPGTSVVDMVIDEETASVTVTSAAAAASGIKVYLFSADGSYLGINRITDQTGRVSFDLPIGLTYSFRADILGSQYWSLANEVTGGGVNSIGLDAGGGNFQVRIQEDETTPMEGVKTYLFSAGGSNLGQSRTSDATGGVAFDVPAGDYKVRADYLGYRFWTEATHVTTDTTIPLPIAHRNVSATVESLFAEDVQPLSAVKVYLFDGSGSYLGLNKNTDQQGRVVFHLPALPYQVRADYLSRQYWSEVFTWTDPSIELAMADTEITVTGGGFPLAGENVYVFTPGGSYLGLNQTTDANGKVFFRLPQDSYKFRADHQDSQYWSGEEMLTAHVVNPVGISTGGGSFTVTVEKAAGQPILGVNCYVFNANDNYLGMFGATDANGQVSFDLADGSYKFRIDYLGSHFWSETADVPTVLSSDLTIGHENVEVSVFTGAGPAANTKVYLLAETSDYLGLFKETGADGKVSFSLPVDLSYRFRADILERQYWSELTTIVTGSTNTVPIDAGGGTWQVTVQEQPGVPMPDIKVYLFDADGDYLGLQQTTNASGQVAFEVPLGTYKVRADHLGYPFFSQETLIDQDISTAVTIEHRQTQVAVTGTFQGTPGPLAGIDAYLFTATDSYLGIHAITDAEGKIFFNLPQKDYKVRVDYLGRHYWSGLINWADALVDIPMAEAVVTVTGGGFPQSGEKVYVFSDTGTYLGLSESTDSGGEVRFTLPVGTYQFRVDHQGSKYWSKLEVIEAGFVNTVIISTGGGSFTFSVETATGQALAGAKCYVFSGAGAYLGILGATDSEGKVFFDLADGEFKFRVDHMGYQFWSPVRTVPDVLADSLNLGHQDVIITVEGLYQAAQPLEGLKTYLFTPGGSYLGQYRITDPAGQVIFSLPDQPYKVRVDYFGHQFWSENFQHQDQTRTINQGKAVIHATRVGADVEGAKVYLFTESGSYLGRSEISGPDGKVEFILPSAGFKFRVDEGGNQVWSPAVAIEDGLNTLVEISFE
jgi:hypothetical protein